MSTQVMKENKMGVMSVGKLLANMALPMIASMLCPMHLPVLLCGFPRQVQ